MVKWLMEYFDQFDLIEEMENTIEMVWNWSHSLHGYKSKNERLKEWFPDKTEVTEVVYKIFIYALLFPQGMTYQAMIGALVSSFPHKNPLDRAKTAAEVIALAYQCDLVMVTKVSDRTMLITTNHQLAVEVPQFHRHQPNFNPLPLVDYKPILGCQFKQHDGDVCIEHLDRMNSVPLTLEHRLIAEMPELPSMEDMTVEQQREWDEFQRASLETYSRTAKHASFRLRHHYDTRGRCYCEGYYVNYQGSSFKKAIVQLADKEVVRL